ncbi:NPCBM/NEW2 domain-containing protein [Emticicia oligotrophica]|uniref:NPCBM/NEW2 domain-containing protein n=1 Tax=Emticicia oligotrophica TaxID=312279 RepID=UPI00273B8D40|nr:NPCBM/NEW2 domain-containing protein [Emticicia oligotrophica]
MKITQVVLYLLVTIELSAQITITFPMENAVFQRSASNTAVVNIAGNYNGNISSVEARFTNVINNQVVIDWTPFTIYMNGGIFNGYVNNVPGGWYKLEIRGILGSSVVSTTTLNRLGVGEVFLIAGQSNAQGIEGNQGEVGASDERVVSHNEISWFDASTNACDKKVPNYPAFSQITSNGSTKSFLSKTGHNPWCYGRLGDMLVSKLGVPVVFINAAAMATSSINWKESSDGLATISHFSNEPYCNTSGVPYSGFQKALNYYASIFGVRAILWHQGEADNYIANSQTNYTSNVNYIISKSRALIGNVPWVISRASVFDKNANGGTGNQNLTIINAQNAVINSSNKIYPGPSTDDILGSNRSDEVHFYGPGLIELANRWDASLSIDFFNSATPISAKPLPLITVSCQSATLLRLSAPNGYSSYKWVRIDTGNNDYEDATEASTQSIERTSGTYRCYLVDSKGNITFTQPVIVQNVAEKCNCVGIVSCTGVTYLSDNAPCSSSNGWGPIEMNKSNGEYGQGDGTTIKLKGVEFKKGIGVHANSTINYHLNYNFGRFISSIGIDDEVANAIAGTNVIFKVYKDNVLSYSSGIVNKSTPTININIDVTGVNELRLEVDQANDDSFSDHADWANARLHCVDSQAPTTPANLRQTLLSQNCVTLNWNASTDNNEIEKYNIYQDGTLIASVDASTLSYRVTGLNSFNFYSFYVVAVDYTGNVSTPSNNLEIVTLQNLTITIESKNINKGQSTTLSASGCFGGTVTWSNGSTSNPITVSPKDTTVYTVFCKIADCTSAITKDTVNVIPDCLNSYNLVRNRDNYGGTTISISLNSSQTITASNIIYTEAKVGYNAAKSITLLPGFTSEKGAIFTAQISNCPNSTPVSQTNSATLDAIPRSETKLKRFNSKFN